ncbi:hypothetical protein GA0115240_156319 [Streptomyces sp. DvalAA-14]|nr:hypothetical protein GA0115240_156319 [Streptomyces sp. DvalAA-14]
MVGRAAEDGGFLTVRVQWSRSTDHFPLGFMGHFSGCPPSRDRTGDPPPVGPAYGITLHKASSVPAHALSDGAA